MTVSSLNQCGHLEWAIASRTAPGEALSGDAAVVRPRRQHCLLAVIDGLGHGPEAAAAAAVAQEIFERNDQLGVTDLLSLAHEGLLGGRGVVATVATVDGRAGTLSWLGVGNVEGVVVHRETGSGQRTSGVLLRGGVLGRELPRLHEAGTVQLGDRDCIALATDGVKGDLVEALRTGLTTDRLARRLLDEHGSETDDALVLVARYRAQPFDESSPPGADRAGRQGDPGDPR